MSDDVLRQIAQGGLYQTGPKPTTMDLILDGVARWATEEPYLPMDPATYTGWCQRCQVNHSRPEDPDPADPPEASTP